MPSGRAAAVGISAMVAAALLLLAVTGAGKRTSLVLTNAVRPILPVAPVAPGSTVCQKPFGITEAFDRVRFKAGTFGRPGPPLVVSVTSEQSGAELGWGRLPGWAGGRSVRSVDVGHVNPGERVDVCIRNDGRTLAYVYGAYYHGFSTGPRGVTGPLGLAPINSTNAAYVDGVLLEGDVAISLYGSEQHSALARIPAMIRHAATFKVPFVGPWLFWILGLLVLVGAPIALWAALTSATRAVKPRRSSSPRSRRRSREGPFRCRTRGPSSGSAA